MTNYVKAGPINLFKTKVCKHLHSRFACIEKKLGKLPCQGRTSILNADSPSKHFSWELFKGFQNSIQQNRLKNLGLPLPVRRARAPCISPWVMDVRERSFPCVFCNAVKPTFQWFGPFSFPWLCRNQSSLCCYSPSSSSSQSLALAVDKSLEQTHTHTHITIEPYANSDTPSATINNHDYRKALVHYSTLWVRSSSLAK